MPWLASQGDTTLSAGDAQGDAFELSHTFLYSTILTRPLHTKIMQRYLNVHLGRSLQGLHEEVASEVDQCLGKDMESYRKADLHHLMARVISKVLCRMCGGESLCKTLKPFVIVHKV